MVYDFCCFCNKQIRNKSNRRKLDEETKQLLHRHNFSSANNSNYIHGNCIRYNIPKHINELHQQQQSTLDNILNISGVISGCNNTESKDDEKSTEQIITRLQLQCIIRNHTDINEHNKFKMIFEWPQIIVKDSPGKGKGLFAKINLPVNTIIPVWGENIDECDLHIRHFNNQSKYIYQVKKNELIDGNPELFLDNCININIWGYINEPNANEVTNCSMVNGRPYVKVIKRIRKNDELLMNYGKLYIRDYDLNNTQ